MKKIIASIMVGAVLLSGCSTSENFSKDWKAEFDGLNRQITVYSFDGSELASFRGRYDIDYEDGRVKLTDLNNSKRHIIYGTGFTVVAEEVVE